MPLVVLSLLLALAGQDTAAPDRKVFPKGRLIENVTSDSAPGQKFSIYVPTSYDASTPAPILYLMDPRSRGRVPARLFQAAAERFGYILFSSHNTVSDGPMEPNLHAMQAMWNDSHDWFRLDERRVYLAGFSGTARTASLIAQNRPQAITGIIGAGAGLHPDVKPSATTPFLYFGTVGTVDYNFHEVEAVERRFAAFDLPHRVERFAGPHSWMPPELAMQAIEWMELRAMRAGTRPRDEGLIDAWWRRDEAAAQARLASVRPLPASRRYAAMVRDYAGLRDTSTVAAEAARLAATAQAQAELKRRSDEAAKTAAWIASAMATIARAYPPGADHPAASPAELARSLQIAELKRVAAGLAIEPALEAQRRLNELEVQIGFYLPHDALERNELTRASYYLTVAVQIDEKSPVSWYLTAETYARRGAARDAVGALRRAVEVGFRDLAALTADPAFRALHADPEFADVLDLLRNSGDGLDALTVDRPPFIL